MEPVREGLAMVRGMDPRLAAGRYAFVSHAAEPPDDLLAAALGVFREAEGVSLIVPAEMDPDAQPMRLITLQVHSALDGVGLTAAVSTALAAAGVPCNMVAAYHHDHVFVPAADAERALGVLRRLAVDAI